MKQFWMLAAASLALSACGAADDAADAAQNAAADAVEATESAADSMADTVTDMAMSPAPVMDEDYDVLSSDGFCTSAGPQTPRDISFTAGTNPDMFMMAPATTEMNLCNIHTHTNAEHKGPGFSLEVGTGEYDGYQCNDTPNLTEAELAPYEGLDFGKVKPGDTIEVHWVHTTCDIEPGEGLGSCLSDTCEDPLLRVEAQTFLVVNDRDAADFMDFAEVVQAGGKFQPAAIPTGTGEPVVFRGSTTGPSYDAQGVCSPLRVTWSVRPECTKLDIASLDAWAESGNVFNETDSHGIRPLVTDPRLISAIGN
jgi:hypothetical protein